MVGCILYDFPIQTLKTPTKRRNVSLSLQFCRNPKHTRNKLLLTVGSIIYYTTHKKNTHGIDLFQNIISFVREFEN